MNVKHREESRVVIGCHKSADTRKVCDRVLHRVGYQQIPMEACKKISWWVGLQTFAETTGWSPVLINCIMGRKHSNENTCHIKYILQTDELKTSRILSA